LEDVGNVGEESGPSLGVGAFGRGSRTDGLVRNDIPRDGKADPGDLMGIRNDRLGGVNVAAENGAGEDNDENESQDGGECEAMAALPCSEEGPACWVHRSKRHGFAP
jgi:hypothetical protein